MIRSMLIRDLKLAARVGGGAELGLVFFLILVAVFPFAIGPETKLLARLAPAILWLAALLATLLGLDRLFQADEEDGVIDQVFLSETPLELIVFLKALAHWLSTGLPMVFAAPLFGLMLSIEPDAMLPLTATLLIGTPALTMMGTIGAALTVSLRRGGLLLSILVLPFTVPTLIFGVAAVNEVMAGGLVLNTPFLLMSSITLLMLALGPVAAAAALRLSKEG